MFIILKKKKMLLIIFLIVFATLISFNLNRIISAINPPPKTVILDAGHGGVDGGASGSTGVLEKDLNLAITMKIKVILEQKKIPVVMTRQEDVSIHDEDKNSIRNKKKSDLKNRANLINNYNDGIFVSIHMNKFENPKYSGAQVFYGRKDVKSELLAEIIQTALRENIDPSNNRMIKKADDGIFILKNANIPSCIVECGFLSNPTEEKNLKDANYQQKMAQTIADAIIKFMIS